MYQISLYKVKYYVKQLRSLKRKVPCFLENFELEFEFLINFKNFDIR